MRVLRKCVSTGQHEQRAVEHVIEIEYPRCWRVQDVTLEDFDTNNGNKRDDRPRRSIAYPGANTVNRVQDALDAHPLPPLSDEEKLRITKHHPVASPNGALPFQRVVRSASWHSVRSSDRTPSSGSQRYPAPTAWPALQT